MSDSTPKPTRRFRRGLLAPPVSLTPAATILYFFTFLLALYQLDRQNYQNAKRDLIQKNFYEIFKAPDELTPLAKEALYASTPTQRQDALRRLEEQMRDILNGPSSFYELILTGLDGETVLHVADPDKPSRQRTLTNTLLLPGYSSILATRIRRSEDSTQPSGQLLLRYSTPPDYPPLKHLTLRYWFYVAVMAVLWALGYAFLYVRVLRPMRRVTRRLAESQEAPPRLIERPQVLLEFNYNQMAAQALLQILEERLTAILRPAEAGGAPKAKVISEALASLRDWFGVRDCQAAELSGGREDLAVSMAYAPPGESPPASCDLLTRTLALELVTIEGDKKTPAASAESRFAVGEDGHLHYAGRIGSDSILVVFGRVPAAAAGATDGAFARLPIVRRACEIIRRALLAHRALEQDVFRQKSEANIVLSRNLGHDLTNIIATTKLDLMAVRRLLEKPGNLTAGDPRTELLGEAVRGILESTRFLQEIVNIYRSFSHIKRPQYERRDLNALVDEFLRVFEPSVSTRVELRREFASELPNPIVEPRLLKLALFNVLTNALDAHKRAPKLPRPEAGNGNGHGNTEAPEAPGSPFILIRTRFEPAGQVFMIQIEDNGPGIRDPNGRLLEPWEVDAIFRHGYSTKAAEASEGLGLSWVRTIIEQFHNGRVRAENLPQGGARMTLAIHSMETAEAKIP